MVDYTESYGYDGAGNILEMKHRAGSVTWTRGYFHEEGTNRIRWTSIPGDPTLTPSRPAPRYEHNEWGNMTRMFDRVFHWDAFDRLEEVELEGGGKAHYQYDGTGERVRKVIERIGGVREERLYLGGYEVHRRTAGGELRSATENVHVMDDRQRVALVETIVPKTRAPSTTVTLVRYQLDDHLGSATVELDERGGIITYDAYHPYGSTAFRTARKGFEVADKRYRYNGKERDDETGLHYYGARYYAAWLGRWTQCDPEGDVDGPNLYAYVRGSPVRFVDATGTSACDSQARCHAEVSGSSAPTLPSLTSLTSSRSQPSPGKPAPQANASTKVSQEDQEKRVWDAVRKYKQEHPQVQFRGVGWRPQVPDPSCLAARDRSLRPQPVDGPVYVAARPTLPEASGFLWVRTRLAYVVDYISGVLDTRFSSVKEMVDAIINATGNSKITTLTIEAHGGPGHVSLGRNTIMSSNFHKYYAEEFKRLQGHFVTDGRVDLVVCEVGQDSELIQQFANTIGVPVSAVTGNYTVLPVLGIPLGYKGEKWFFYPQPEKRPAMDTKQP